MKVNPIIMSAIWMVNIVCYGYCREIKKRQLYREQVLPHAGGKIPDTAFQTDRLALNRLQKEGIAIPDGVILEQRNPQVFPHTKKDNRPVFRVALIPDYRYTRREGQYPNPEENSIETTYSIPQITKPYPNSLHLPSYQKNMKPVYKQLEFTAIPHHTDPIAFAKKYNFYEQNYPNSYGLTRWPIQSQYPYDWRIFQNDYVASHIYNDFESFFNQLTSNYKVYKPILQPYEGK